MTVYEHDHDVRWGLHLIDVCSLSNGHPETVTCYEKDLSWTESVTEGFCNPAPPSLEENNEVVNAHAPQEDFSRFPAAYPSLDWPGNSEWQSDSGFRTGESSHEIEDEWLYDEVGKRLNQMVSVPHVPKINGELPSADEATSDHERLLNRLNLYDLVEVKIIDTTEVHLKMSVQRKHFTYLLFRGFQTDAMLNLYDLIELKIIGTTEVHLIMSVLNLYDLVELKIMGDGNCQFRSLSDQIYRTSEHHKFVREQVVNQLKSQPELYANYVPMAYDDYLKNMSKNGEWGDHVTLQAAADCYGVRIFVVTSFKDTCYIEILPQYEKSNRIILLSFWAEVHYNSIYPSGESPPAEGGNKKKRWWSR